MSEYPYTLNGPMDFTLVRLPDVLFPSTTLTRGSS
jgi:hypothetical protein